MTVRHLSLAELRAGLAHIQAGRRLHLRGINAKTVQAGSIRVGDLATKVRRFFGEAPGSP